MKKQIPIPNYIRHTPKGINVSKNLETTCDKLELYYDDGRANYVRFPLILKWGKKLYRRIQVTTSYRNNENAVFAIYANGRTIYKIIGKEE